MTLPALLGTIYYIWQIMSMVETLHAFDSF